MSVTGPHSFEEVLKRRRTAQEDVSRRSLIQDPASGWQKKTQPQIPSSRAGFRESSRVIQTGDIASRRHRDLHLESKRTIVREEADLSQGDKDWSRRSLEAAPTHNGSDHRVNGRRYLFDEDGSVQENGTMDRPFDQPGRDIRYNRDIAQPRGASPSPSLAMFENEHYDDRFDDELSRSYTRLGKWKPPFILIRANSI
jgi:hypothetical protein